MLFCRNSEDNLSLVKLLYQTLFPEGGTDTLSSSTLLLSIQEAIASLNEKTADWIIELYVHTYGSKPTISMQAVYESHRYGQHLKKSRGYTIRPDCVAWLLDKYSGKCDVKFSERDAVESHCK
ncbi:hypothetical protein Pelo_19720 [Pelomyxa schiedti]|nr:hypothetical protein Pelo_19720 [Pelomyxa schiedti]